MTRIFTTLAAVVALALLLSFGVGTLSRLSSAAAQGQALFQAHFLIGLFTVIGTLLVHCLIFTYLLGTGRWVKEVALAYRFPDEPFPRQTRELKRKTFPPALAAMLITIATAAAGAGALFRDWHWSIHSSISLVAIGINFWAFRVEYRNVSINGLILDEVLKEVDRIRAAHGLPSNAEALERSRQPSASA